VTCVRVTPPVPGESHHRLPEQDEKRQARCCCGEGIPHHDWRKAFLETSDRYQVSNLA
jgi:hypothetical protein